LSSLPEEMLLAFAGGSLVILGMLWQMGKAKNIKREDQPKETMEQTKSAFGFASDDDDSKAFAVGGFFSRLLIISGMLIAVAGVAIWVLILFGIWSATPGNASIADYGLPILPLIPYGLIAVTALVVGALTRRFGKMLAYSHHYHQERG
jgi:hypothetical protein